ncbi:metallophosphoesterase family protein [Nitrospinae bacterium AH-259-F20]|nr:metallophosphoesterase family protein [Nitrospinae bacterium AH-259-F20]
MKIGVISDTHGFCHPRVFQLFEGAELILHAGDIGDETIITDLEAIAPVTAVFGNIDRPPPDRAVPGPGRSLHREPSAAGDPPGGAAGTPPRGPQGAAAGSPTRRPRLRPHAPAIGPPTGGGSCTSTRATPAGSASAGSPRWPRCS